MSGSATPKGSSGSVGIRTRSCDRGGSITTRPNEVRLVLLQGDTRWAGDPSDGSVARRQIAQVVIRSLGSDAAVRKTFELLAERGPAPENFDALFAQLQADPLGSLDGAQDIETCH